MDVEAPTAFAVVITMDFIEAIGLYKLAMGIDDEETREVSAALQVRLAEVVGP